MNDTAKYKSPLGIITLACDGERLTGLWFDGQKYFGSTLGTKTGTDIFPANPNTFVHEKSLPIFRQTKEWLDLYFHGKIPDFTPPISLIGSPFRLAVWELLLQIPYGETTTYGELARMVDSQREKILAPTQCPGETISAQPSDKITSARAVGGAVGHNPISIIVPCHRVIGSDGSLTGYAGGVDKKVQLLRLEGVDMG